MKHISRSFFHLFTLLVLSTQIVLADAPYQADAAMLQKIKTDAQSCSSALFKNDLDTVLRLTHPRLMEVSGGQEALKAALVATLQDFVDKGIKLEEVTVGEPFDLKTHDGWIVGFVPTLTKITTSIFRITATGHLLAISEDEGKTWTFLDMASTDKAVMGMLFPKLVDVVAIPEKKAPVIERL